MGARILITMGDPAGVGPELSLRALEMAQEHGLRLAVVGSGRLLERVAKKLSFEMPAVVSAERFMSDPFASDRSIVIDVLGPDGVGLDAAAVRPGVVDRETGYWSLAYVNWAIDAVQNGLADAIVTGPIHKEAWHQAGAEFPGHTELFAKRAGAARHCMMLAAPQIRCALVTVHVGLAEVPGLLTVDGIYETIDLAADAVSKVLGRPACITVLGLNPHAGEGGLFGDGEEERVIQPAIDRAVAAGLLVSGPLPPDTAFIPAIRSKTDVYICMYHDQGLIPLKALAFDEAVNVTLGLGMVRTSVDHGTALDIAWKGVADSRSMQAAVKMASDLASDLAGGQ